jgi:hypothetical protein
LYIFSTVGSIIISISFVNRAIIHDAKLDPSLEVAALAAGISGKVLLASLWITLKYPLHQFILKIQFMKSPESLFLV